MTSLSTRLPNLSGFVVLRNITRTNTLGHTETHFLLYKHAYARFKIPRVVFCLTFMVILQLKNLKITWGAASSSNSRRAKKCRTGGRNVSYRGPKSVVQGQKLSSSVIMYLLALLVPHLCVSVIQNGLDEPIYFSVFHTRAL